MRFRRPVASIHEKPNARMTLTDAAKKIAELTNAVDQRRTHHVSEFRRLEVEADEKQQENDPDLRHLVHHRGIVDPRKAVRSSDAADGDVRDEQRLTGV